MIIHVCVRTNRVKGQGRENSSTKYFCLADVEVGPTKCAFHISVGIVRVRSVALTSFFGLSAMSSWSRQLLQPSRSTLPSLGR
eukprot:24221-Amphidinium_carterae.1